MSKKETVLIKVAFLVELSDEEINNVDGLLDKIMTKVGNDETLLVDNKSIDLKWINTSSHTLDVKSENCGRCANCGGWTTDREKPNYIPELCDGATVNGSLLCDECLPSDHRWAF
jgi:hypothetical protein